MKKSMLIGTLVLTFIIVKTSSAQTPLKQPTNTLEVNRKKIDSLDQKLIETIGLREKLVKEIGEYKAKNNIPPLQASRFQEVLNRAVAKGKEHDLSETFITELMNAIHKESLRIENVTKGNTQ